MEKKLNSSGLQLPADYMFMFHLCITGTHTDGAVSNVSKYEKKLIGSSKFG